MLLAIGGLVLVRTINIDRDSPMPVVPPPTVHTVKQLLLPGTVPFQTLFWNEFGHANAGVTTINRAEVWSAFWHNETLCNISNTCSNLPQVDFDSRTVLVVAAGLQGSPGYHINVTRVIAGPADVLVQATLTTPGPNCLWVAVITFPIQVIEILQTNLPMILEITEVPAPACSY